MHLSSDPIDLASLFTRQLIFVSGKGGTGKTTLAIFLAQMAAKQGKRVLLCHINRLAQDSWEQQYLAAYPQLSQIVITPNSSFKEYMLLKFKSETIYHRFFESSTELDVLRRAAPALNDLLILGKIYWECRQRTFWFAPKWDHVIVDLPSTGHAATLLNIPSVVLNIFRRGIVSHETSKMFRLISDPERTCLVLTCLPEALAIRETLTFMDLAQHDLEIQLGPVFLNKTLHLPLSAEASEIYETERDRLSDAIQQMVNFARQRYLDSNEQSALLRKHSSSLVYALPFIFGGTPYLEFCHTFETQLLQHWINSQTDR